jgi:hypothetical protein
MSAPEIGPEVPGNGPERLRRRGGRDGADLVHWQTGAPVDDPVGKYAAAAERVLAASAAAGLLAGEFVLPEISRPVPPIDSGRSGQRYG